MKNISLAFEESEVLQISRSENAIVDLLLKLAILECYDLQKMTYLEVINKLNIEEELAPVLQANFQPSWIDPLVDYF